MPAVNCTFGLRGNTLDNPYPAAEQFKPEGRVTDIREFGNGNIHKTYLVTVEGGHRALFVLQLINTRVFRQPELVMRNMRIATDHMRNRLAHAPLHAGRRWEVPEVFMAHDGRDHWTDSDGSFWRAISFIGSARSFDIIRDTDHAGEMGNALGIFHTLLSDLPPDKLTDTLEGFHITPRYLRYYEGVLLKASAEKSPDVNYCIRFISERAAWAGVLEDAHSEGKLRLRPIHGDPKVNNIMMDTATGQAVGMIDLDTVKPGLIHYDIGDLLRSGCNPLGEETEQWERVLFEPDLCKAILRGYLPTCREFLTVHDLSYIYDAVRLIAFELGLRFFTDYLEGNVYFKVSRPEHNLARALVQFRLTASLESQEAVIRSIIREAG